MIGRDGSVTLESYPSSLYDGPLGFWKVSDPLTDEPVMSAAMNGTADVRPFVPSIYEHGPRVIGEEPGEVCRSADLTAAN